ncbi:MAG TPA: orotidine-5'-phosphate decarboxylase [Candidatus Saccharimonadales bacterium]|nr:orotidine-5'-phosphate decarboxylase [Candidatus Saccharimonadales bacterium]
MKFSDKLNASAKARNSLACVGLDPDHRKLPTQFKGQKLSQFIFNKAIIDATADLVLAYKPQAAFYEALGADGVAALKATCDYLRTQHPDIPIILDAKRGDIGSTNDGYIEYVFDYLGVDALTLHPYLGKESLTAFLAQDQKGLIILCRTSNPGAGEFQDLTIDGRPLYQIVAKHVVDDWSKQGDCLMVVGATYPKEMAEIRAMAPEMWFLVPGIGAQGGDLEATLNNGLRKDKAGLIISSSRGIIFASSGADFAKAARSETQKLRDDINKLRR